MPRFYLDLRAHRESATAGQTPFTPAIAVVYQVDEGIRLMQAEGGRAVFARHEACAAASRAGLDGARLRAVRRSALRVADGDRRASSPTASTGRRSTRAIKRHGVVLAGGQGKLTGKIFRLGHLGSVTRRGDPRRDRASWSVSSSSRAAGSSRPGRGSARRRGAGGRRVESSGADRAGTPPGPAVPREGPRRRAHRRGGRRPASAPTTRSTSGRASAATSSARSCPTTTRSSSAARSRSTPT